MTDLVTMLGLAAAAVTCHVAGVVLSKVAPSMPRGLAARAAA